MKIGTVTFLWPTLLWLLAAIPLLVALYLWLLGRQRRAARRFANLETVGGARATGSLRHHAPALLLLLGLTALVVAIARPQALIALPARLETVILALDISGSMKATDIAPNRISAAQAAAKAFVAEQPRHVRIGVVGIAASAAVVQSPTDNREDIVQAIDRLEPQRGTALGSGLVIALDAALPAARIDVEAFMNPRKGSPPENPARSVEDAQEPRAAESTAAVVLLSDGQSNVGPELLKAAELAAQHGVRVYTIGVGTTEGTTVTADGWSMRTRLDEETLKKVASMTQAEYFRAGNAIDLKSIYSGLGAKLGLQKPQPTEVTAIVAAVGAVLALAGALLSMLWFNRVL